MRNAFENEKCSEKNEKWKQSIKRETEIYARNNDIRSEFERDYTRLLHSQAYRRLKHKTQVFFAPHNDHICTRMEHVSHVASVSSTIGDGTRSMTAIMPHWVKHLWTSVSIPVTKCGASPGIKAYNWVFPATLPWVPTGITQEEKLGTSLSMVPRKESRLSL